MRYILAICVALLTGCAQLPAVPESNAPITASACTTTYTGPCVEGKLAGSQDETWIPFSNYTGNAPVIATEEFATKVAAPGTAQVLSSANFTPTTLVNGDYFILYGTTNFTMPRISALTAAGVPDGSRFILQGYKAGVATTVTYVGDVCYTANNSGCPTTINFGEAFLFIMNGNVWRSIPLIVNPTLPVLRSHNTAATISQIGDRDVLDLSGANSYAVTINAGNTLGLKTGQRFLAASYLNASKTVTLNFQENVYVATSAGVSTTKQIVLQPGQSRLFIWWGTTWYSYPVSQ